MNKNVIRRQIAKAITDAINVCDIAIKVQEFITNNPKIIKKSDELKDKLEKNTSIHIARSYDIGIKIDRTTDEYKQLEQTMKGKGEEVYQSHLEDIKEMELKEEKEQGFAVIAVMAIYLFIFFLIVFALMPSEV